VAPDSLCETLLLLLLLLLLVLLLFLENDCYRPSYVGLKMQIFLSHTFGKEPWVEASSVFDMWEVLYELSFNISERNLFFTRNEKHQKHLNRSPNY
jgi:hypothetical protein